MKYISTCLLVCIVLFASCKNRAHTPVGIGSVKDTTGHKIKYPDTPDFNAHIAPLLAYWARHKQESVFDTGISFEDQGFGPVDNFYNFVKAGHLFSQVQTHALFFYDIGMDGSRPLARIFIYKKNTAGTTWNKVLDDTIQDCEYRIRYKDWNSDGTNDFSYMQDGWEHGGHGPVTWHLWLVDKGGMPHKVKGFEELDDPQIDSITRHIFSNMEDRTSEEMAEYIFSADSVKKISDDMVVNYEVPEVVNYYRNGHLIKKVKLKRGQRVYTPLYRENIGD